jgi:hypothetical protein
VTSAQEAYEWKKAVAGDPLDSVLSVVRRGSTWGTGKSIVPETKHTNSNPPKDTEVDANSLSLDDVEAASQASNISAAGLIESVSKTADENVTLGNEPNTVEAALVVSSGSFSYLVLDFHDPHPVRSNWNLDIDTK